MGLDVKGFIDPTLSGSFAWRALFESPLPMGVMREDGRLLFANRGLIELFDFPVERLRREWFLAQIFSPEEFSEMRARVADLLASRGITRYRRTITCGDGRKKTIEIETCSIAILDGRRALLGTGRDVTAVPLSVSEGQRGTEALLHDSPDVFFRIDAATQHLVYVSPAIERVLGVAPEAALAEPGRLYRMLSRADRSEWKRALQRAFHGVHRIFELTTRNTKVGQVLLQVALSPIFGANGVRFVEGSARDQTASKRLEEMLQRQREREGLDRLKSQLLGNVSHELRTPLVSIKGYNDLLLRGTLGPLTPRQRRGLEIAGVNAERLIGLIETLLDLQRHEAGQLELQKIQFDLRTVVVEAVEEIRRQRATERNISMRVELGPAPLQVLGDPSRLGSVFRSILGNAEKFSEGGSEIVVTGRFHAEAVEVAVADRGIGIPEEAHARIFDRFFQVDASPTRRFGGAGLGLALAKELVTLHGGEIGVSSVEGGGATFTVRLPWAKSDSIGFDDSRHAVMLVGGTEATLESLRLLLQSPTLQPLDLLSAGYETELLRKARRHRPDLVLLAFEDPRPALESLRRDPETQRLTLVVAPPTLGSAAIRADLVTPLNDPAKLLRGLERLLGRSAKVTRRARVTVVEDEPDILDFIRFLLEREGYEVTCIASGREAIETIQADCDLVILDVALEDSDGIEVCRRLKERTSTASVPILMMTAITGEDVKKGALLAGADGYLMKPFEVDDFVQKVKVHLRSEAQGTAG
jgi:PAS domain S-box-containing protein